VDIKITTLSENTANFGFLAEWGLSILVEVDGLRILMDTGLSFSATHNAQLMGIDLATIDRYEDSEGNAKNTLQDIADETGRRWQIENLILRMNG
jgi:7,8-dihydropterin-6-yl-methyl-4-(beta-D-ribofuranosyl)aminobenzene 5'-phosphate synthase